MIFSIGLENNIEGRSMAWALGHPGCFAYGKDGPAALDAAPQAVHDYITWIAAHTSPSWLEPGEIETRLDETFEGYTIGESFDLTREGYEVNAWFRHDWKPLSAEEVERGLQVIS